MNASQPDHGGRVTGGPAPESPRRIVYLALTIATVAAGLLVHLRGAGLDPTARDVAGDALWAAMIVWLTGVGAPRAPRLFRCAAAGAVCVAVELSQLIHGPFLDAIRGTEPGRLVLGSGFDLRDFGAYALGVGAAALLDAVIVRLTASAG